MQVGVLQACVCNGCKKVCGVGGLLDLANVDETSAVHDGILGICVLSCARAALMKRCVRFYHFATSICAITLRLGNSLTSLGIIRRVFLHPAAHVAVAGRPKDIFVVLVRCTCRSLSADSIAHVALAGQMGTRALHMPETAV